MSWFSSLSSAKNLQYQDLEGLLKQITILDKAEREYVKGLFIKFKEGGINRQEVEKAVRELKFNTGDIIDPTEAEAIKQKLLSAIL